MPFTVSFAPGTDAAKAKDFFAANRHILSRLYPDKWVVFQGGSILFVSDSQEEMFARADSLAMVRGSYFFDHIEPPGDCAPVATFVDGLGI